MPDLNDGETAEVQGSARDPYILKNSAGVYSCTCPAWRNQSVAIEKRTCKHLRKYRGDAAETLRIGTALPQRPVKVKAADGSETDEDEAAGPELLLAHSWSNEEDLTGWWMSEKLDGVRAYWDGKQFISRLGNLYHAPDWFTADLPQVPLDGELWLGRKMFQRAVSIVRAQNKSDLWKGISYVIFDAPAAAGVFEERVEFVKQTLAAHRPQYARPHEHLLCTGLDHLRQELTRVESLGGEGLMLRQPASKYEVGRSSTLLKVKTFHDAEARVVEHLPGAGRHKGRLGALRVELPDGTSFSVGTGFSDAQRASPPAVGSTITFRYQELSDGGVPRFPSFVRPTASTAGAVASSPLPSAPPSATVKPAAPVKPAAASPATTPTSPAATAPSGGAPRYFEFQEGNSSKFWEVVQAGTDVTVRYGRIGAPGQSKTKSFPSDAAAASYAEKLILEKTEKGYEEQEAEE